MHTYHKPGAFMLVLFTSLLLLPNPAWSSQSFNVTSTADDNDALPGDGQCAAASGGCTLRAAVQETNALSGADTILLPAGTYTLTRMGAKEDHAATGDLDITDSLTISGVGPGQTIVDGGKIDRVFEITLITTTVTLEQMTIQRARMEDLSGGGLLSRGSVLLETVVITDNRAADSGGGVSVAEGDLTIRNSMLSNNYSYLGGGIANRDRLTLTNVAIINNESGLNGGGIYNGGDMTMVNVTVSGNYAGNFGGAMDTGSGSTSITHMTMAYNSTPGGSSGIWNVSHHQIHVRNSLFVKSCTSDLLSLGYNISYQSCSPVNHPSDRYINPKLDIELRDNGGPSLTHALLMGSPAVDAADPDNCAATDQRGFARPFDTLSHAPGHCDIGAYEVDTRWFFNYVPILRTNR